MKFVYPIFLIIGIAVSTAMAGIFIWTDRRNRQTLFRLASERLLQNLIASVSWHRRIFKRILLICAILLLFIALARPQWGFRWEEVKRRGIDILFAIDVSKSMLTQDVKPDRLSRAKMAVADLVNELQGDRVGLIAFAGTAFLQCPLTLDYEAFDETLNALDTNTIPKGGTDIASAIQEASSALQTQESNHKILLLLTDGEDLEQRGIQAAQQAARDGLKIFAVGVGTQTGDLIPIADEQGGVQFLKDKNSQIVKSRLDADTLTKIAESTGGFYVPLGQRDSGLEKIYKEGLQSFTKEELSSKMQKIYIDRFQWPLALGLLLLILEFLIHDKKSAAISFEWLARLIKKIQFWKISRKAAIVILLFLPFRFLYASTSSAFKAFEKGDYTASESQYRKEWEKKKDRDALNFNLGAAVYKNEKYDEAENLFQRALSSSNLQMQQKAYYNLGNTQYRLGQQTEKDDHQKTIELWQQAVQSYESALKLNPKDEDAKFNLEFVKKKLQQQQQQQQNQKNQQQNQNKSQNQQDQNKQQQEQNQQQQNQKKQNQEQQKSDQQKSQEDQKKEPSSSKQNEQQKQNQQPQQSVPEERRKPGEMSKEEAEQLLNALKDEQAHPEKEQQIPIGQPQEPDRDW